ncbi:MAG: hypothetical protein FWC91_14105 [Defluviitaleaceae bacterium]|nr:hypothetical protein [Defluviitaleaceae bacterium]
MKNKLFLAAILLFAGLFMTTCFHDVDEIPFIVGVTVDKTEASIGDTITATVVFWNVSSRDIKAQIPAWLVSIMNKPIEDYTIEDILYVRFATEAHGMWPSREKDMEPLPSVFIEKGTVIKRQFEHIVTESKDIRVHAGAFFITSRSIHNTRVWQVFGYSEWIKVQ